MQARELIMDLTNEQGGNRTSQVQPPSEVWEQFFGVRVNANLRPAFRLQNMRVRSNPEQRKVVKHHHNLTIEVGDAKRPRPAILRMRRTGHNAFDYWVYRPSSEAYRHCNWMLTNLAINPSQGRRWLII
jgi:hypothetical protein